MMVFIQQDMNILQEVVIILYDIYQIIQIMVEKNIYLLIKQKENDLS